ncbi:hypothetical protein ACFQ07_03105 [Actinomadura adrarensis]|uniref:DMT family transporter n=1 Tax=Actinomadura adrarensis TaxID=1819600 RepID=A0ABW3C9K6_9ACTN
MTAGNQLTAIQATAVTALFAVPIHGTVQVMCGSRIDAAKLREAAPHTKKRDRRISRLLRRARRFRLVYGILFRLAEMEKKRRWVLTVLPFLVGFVAANLLAQFYVARLPFVTGNAVTILGPITVAVVITLRAGRKGLPLFLPLLAATGAIMMIPWGRPIDLAGMIAALGGAVAAAIMASFGSDLAKAGISFKGSGLALLAGLVLGAPSLAGVNWTHDVVVHGCIAGVLTVGSGLLYWLAQERLNLPKRLATALSANGPALSGIVGRGVLGQNIQPTGLFGIATIMLSSVLNAVLTGTAEEKAEEKSLSYTARKAHAIVVPDVTTLDRRTPKPDRRKVHRHKRPPSWQKQVHRRKAESRTRRE